jgi:transcriptional/translational regulatory protein YebC/TACO1
LEKQKIYLNSFGGRLTGQDFVLLGALRPQGGSINADDEAEVEVYLSPASLKIVHAHISRALETYESIFGEIKLAPTRKAVMQFQESHPEITVQVPRPAGE